MRHEVDFHSTLLERKKVPQEDAKKYREMNYEEVKEDLPDAWTPFKFHDASEQDYFELKEKNK